MMSISDDKSSQRSAGGTYDALPANAIHAAYAREFTVQFGSFPWKKIQLFHANQPAYFCELSEATPRKPDVTLHYAANDGPVLGACHFRRSRSLTCGIGPDETSMVWIKMERQGVLKASAFDFVWAGKHYTMRKATSADVGGTGMSGLVQTHFKVVDNASGSSVGLYVSESGIGRRKGTLKIASGVRDDLQLFIILGIMAWRTKISRDSRQWAAVSAGAS